MKVLMLTSSYEPKVGGTETVVKNLAVKLNERGVRTDVMTFNMAGSWKPSRRWVVTDHDGFKVIRVGALGLPAVRFNPLRFVFKVHVLPDLRFRRLLRDYDVLHFHDDVDLSFLMFSTRLGKHRMFHYHSLQLTIPHFRLNPLLRLIMKRSLDVHIANTRFVEGLIRQLGVEEERIRISTIGVDPDVFKPNEDAREDNLILFVGRLHRWKGLGVLLDSLAYIDTPARLVVIGPVVEPDFAEEVFSRIAAINSHGFHRAEYLGSMTGNDLVAWYQRAAVFAYPLFFESFSVTELEALSCGTPVVASDLEGSGDLIKNGLNGILVPPKDARKFAQAIQYILEHPEVRKSYGSEGRKTVLESFSWQRIAEHLSEIYMECAHS